MSRKPKNHNLQPLPVNVDTQESSIDTDLLASVSIPVVLNPKKSIKRRNIGVVPLESRKIRYM